MIRQKYSNNMFSYDCMDNFYTQKKEEKINSRIFQIDPAFHPIINKSGISSKK